MGIVTYMLLPHLLSYFFCLLSEDIEQDNPLSMSCIEISSDLSEGIRGQIIALSNEGMSQCKIADKVSVSKDAVQRTFRRFKKTGSFSTRPRSCRSRVTTQREDRYIKPTSLRNRMATAGKIQALLNNTRENPVSKKSSKETIGFKWA